MSLQMRELGDKVPVSIGTALALESLIDLPRPRKEDHIFLNLRTLWRNFHGSMTNPNDIKPKKLADAFIEELELIESTVENALDGNWTPIFYVMSSKSLGDCLPQAKIKHPRTDKQKRFAELEEAVIHKVLEVEEWEEKIKIFDTLVRGGNTKALLLSHYPLDLLSKARFKTLKLLESHTGNIKGPAKWGTKLTTNEEYKDLPFNAMMVQLLGDGSNQLLSLGPKYKEPLLKLAKKKKWHANTGVEKIKFDIRNGMRDKLLSAVLLEMLSARMK